MRSGVLSHPGCDGGGNGARASAKAISGRTSATSDTVTSLMSANRWCISQWRCRVRPTDLRFRAGDDRWARLPRVLHCVQFRVCSILDCMEVVAELRTKCCEHSLQRARRPAMLSAWWRLCRGSSALCAVAAPCRPHTWFSPLSLRCACRLHLELASCQGCGACTRTPLCPLLPLCLCTTLLQERPTRRPLLA